MSEYTYSGPPIELISKEDGLYYRLEDGDKTSGLGYDAKWLTDNGFKPVKSRAKKATKAAPAGKAPAAG